MRQWLFLRSRIAILAMLAAAPSLTGQELFLVPAIPVSGTARGLEIADFDADGDLDALVLAGGSLDLLRNDGDGRFGMAESTQLATSPNDLAIGDVDGDGDVDALLTCRLDGGLFVAWNDGTGAFPDITTIPTIDHPDVAALADVDGDGDLDAVVTHVFQIDQIRVYRNDGDGTFVHSGAIIGPSTWPHGLALADVDGDGDEDLVASFWGSFDEPDPLLLYHNDGAGGFGVPVTLGEAAAYTALEFADFDADGDLDLIAGGGTDLTQVFLNDGAGTFSLGETLDHDGYYASRIGIGDLDADGDLDIAVRRRGITAFRNDGQAGFAADPELRCSNPTGIAIADLDADGISEIVASGFGDVRIHRADENGRYPEHEVYEGFADTGVLVDLDGDAVPDLATARFDQPVHVLRGGADGGFLPLTTIDGGCCPRYLAEGDVDGDGDADLVVLGRPQDSAILLRNNGAASFLATDLELGPLEATVGLLLEDLDGDDLPELVVLENAVAIARNLGGTFAPLERFGPSLEGAAIDAADVDVDGDVDLVVAIGETDGVLVLANEGDGTFSTSGIFAGVPQPTGIVLADLDGSGLVDVAVCSLMGSARVLINIGGGVYSPSAAIEIFDDANAIAADDFDGDGDADLVLGFRHRARVSVLRNVGFGAFELEGSYGTCFNGDTPDAFRAKLLTQDLDGDGDADLVPLNPATTVLRNRSRAPGTCFAADLDGDGEVSIVDLSIVLFRWGQAVTPGEDGDATGDGLVDLADLNLVLFHWEDVCD